MSNKNKHKHSHEHEHEHRHMHKPELKPGEEIDLGFGSGNNVFANKREPVSEKKKEPEKDSSRDIDSGRKPEPAAEKEKDSASEKDSSRDIDSGRKPEPDDEQETDSDDGEELEFRNVHEHEHKHKHRHKRKKGSRVKSAVYIFLSFMLAFSLFLLSICLTLRMTVFSNDFMMGCMADTGYYDMVKDEMADKFKSVGHASGLPDEFVDEFVEDMDLIEIEREYISSFYSGKKTLVDTMHFKQDLMAALDRYIEKNNIDRNKASEENLSYLVDHMSKVYVNMVSIPFFSVVGNYLYKLDTPLRAAEIGLGVFALVIAAIIFFTNQYMHRRFRYLCYGFTGAFLTVAVIPSVVMISGIIPKINLDDRSLYSLFIGYMTSLFNHFWIYVGILAFLSCISFAIFIVKFKKALGK